MAGWHTFASIVLLSSIQQGLNQDFGYNEENGPLHWGEKYKGCVGKRQSPIDITDDKINIVKLGDVEFTNFKEIPDDAIISNNGHTVMVQLNGPSLPKISGGPLRGTYKFVQLHFHWGENDLEGSENKINNHSFPMELHMVFYKSSYGNASEATLHHDGLTVLSFLYRISKRNNTNYDVIINSLKNVPDPGNASTIFNMTHIDSLLMDDRKQYFTYDGSLTTPPCSEVVTWIEFRRSIPMSHRQLEEFRNLNNEDGKMTHNFRPTQKINDRIIYFNPGSFMDDIHVNKIDIPSQSTTHKSTASATVFNAFIFLLCILGRLI